MSDDGLEVSRAGPALILRLARPHRRNALNLALMDAIETAIAGADANGDIRAVIITGDPQCFSAGADLTELREVSDPAAALGFFRRCQGLCAALEACGKPVIAAIEGFCMTGGLELALACDIRIAGEGSRFAMTSARIGTVPAMGGTQRLPRLVGPARAIELLFAAEPIDGAEAARIGLVNRVVTAGGALAAAQALAALYAERAPMSLAFAKRAVYRGLQMDLASGLDFETMLATTIYGTEDKREGVTAFLEKRRPRFTGR